MQNLKSSRFSELLITLCLSLLIGFLTLAFLKGLEAVAVLHTELNRGFPVHLFLIPVVLIIIELTKRNTLYFPFRTSHLVGETSSTYWTVFIVPFHFVGTLLSHLSGVSVGRESAVVLFASGLSRLCSLEWTFWGPITGSIGFAAITGQYWVAPFFMMELFGKTRFIQKIYSLMGAMLAVLIVNSFSPELFFKSVVTTEDLGFFKKVFFLFFFAACAGYLMRFYKLLYFVFSNYFSFRALWLKTVVSGILGFFLYLPEFRNFQSLGLAQLREVHLSPAPLFTAVTKLFFTLLSTTLGFMGGEFIPLIFSGVHFGHGFFSYFGFDAGLGAALGTYILFAAATRFKYTSYILVLTLMGSSWWFWAFFTVSIATGFSGPQSIYKKEYSH